MTNFDVIKEFIENSYGDEVGRTNALKALDELFNNSGRDRRINHRSVVPPIQWMKDYLAQKPMEAYLEYINWAMDYTDNFMFVDLKSRAFREHFNILKEACEKYLNEQNY